MSSNQHCTKLKNLVQYYTVLFWVVTVYLQLKMPIHISILKSYSEYVYELVYQFFFASFSFEQF